MSSIEARDAELTIVQVDLACGHVLERLAPEASVSPPGSLTRCPWCGELQLVTDVTARS